MLASIRPESVELSTERLVGENVWQGRVAARAFLGDAVDHVVAVGGIEMRVRTAPTVSIQPKTEVFVQLNADSLSLVPAD